MSLANYVVIDTVQSKCINIIYWDGVSTLNFGPNQVTQLSDNTINIGDIVELASGNVWVKTLTVTPTNLAIVTNGSGQVSLTWNQVANINFYSIKRATTSGGPYTLVKTVTTNTTLNRNLTNGTTYYYVISATGTDGESSNSSEVSIVPSA